MMVYRRCAVFVAMMALGLVSCVDDTVVQSVQTSGEGRFRRGHAPRIEVTAGGLNVHTEGFVLKISPGGFAVHRETRAAICPIPRTTRRSARR